METLANCPRGKMRRKMLNYKKGTVHKLITNGFWLKSKFYERSLNTDVLSIDVEILRQNFAIETLLQYGFSSICINTAREEFTYIRSFIESNLTITRSKCFLWMVLPILSIKPSNYRRCI